MGIAKSVKKMGVDPSIVGERLDLVVNIPEVGITGYEMRPLFTASKPNFVSDPSFGLVQIPMWAQMTNSTMDELKLTHAVIKLKDPSND